MRDLLLQALKRQSIERPPVWLMRQAGRYMIDYQMLRAKHSLWSLFHDPELAAKVTMLPIDLLNVDAAILFSDILVLAEVFGCKIIFPEQGGPYVTPFIDTLTAIENLVASPALEKLRYVAHTIQLVKPTLTVPLLGFSAGPFTLASYMIEGAGRAGFTKTKSLIEHHEKHFSLLLNKIADACIDFLRLQIQSGADAVQIFDSWASVLSAEQFRLFCLPYWKKIMDGLKDLGVPLVFFCRDSHRFVADIASIAPHAISIDEKGSMADIRKIIGPDIALQGNLCSQFLRDASRDMVIQETQKLLLSMEGEKGVIMNLGHGILPATPFENVKVFVETVKNFKGTMH